MVWSTSRKTINQQRGNAISQLKKWCLISFPICLFKMQNLDKWNKNRQIILKNNYQIIRCFLKGNKSGLVGSEVRHNLLYHYTEWIRKIFLVFWNTWAKSYHQGTITNCAFCLVLSTFSYLMQPLNYILQINQYILNVLYQNKHHWKLQMQLFINKRWTL